MVDKGIVGFSIDGQHFSATYQEKSPSNIAQTCFLTAFLSFLLLISRHIQKSPHSGSEARKTRRVLGKCCFFFISLIAVWHRVIYEDVDKKWNSLRYYLGACKNTKIIKTGIMYGRRPAWWITSHYVCETFCLLYFSCKKKKSPLSAIARYTP